MVDRCSVEFKTVICKNCGLVRAPKYFRKDDVDDFYKNFYRTIMNNSEDYNEPEKFFERQTINSLEKYKLIKENSNNDLKGLKVLDLGGGAGGALEHFKNDNDLYLADFFDPYLEYAKKKGVNVIKSGLKDINFKPDIIILSHVIEHWNDFEIEIQNLINIQKKNKTINYIELPGIDSLKNGRRGGDFLQDIHIPHVYYFSSYVLENLMNKYGFEKLYIDSEIKSLFIYTGEKKETKKYYKKVKEDLIKAEFRRKIQIFKNIIKIFIPRVVLNIIKRN
jgi:ubiquinone/menaquinone biosynthesis C-methylase UbiE